MTDILTALNPILATVGTGPNRMAQRCSLDFLPAGTKLVSTDDHWEINEDIYYEQLPPHLKEFAPRVWFNKIWWAMPRNADAGDAIPAEIDPLTMEVAWNAAAVRGYSRDTRSEDIAAEGIWKSIVFPNTILAMMYHPNLELREAVFKIYNRKIAQETHEQSGFHGVAVMPNWWDEDKAEAQIKEIQDLGLKTLMLPTQPRLNDGKLLNFADTRFDKFWAALERSGLPLCMHIGENFPGGDQRGVLGFSMHQLAPFRMPLGQMIFGGVFERHPGVKVVFAEGGIAWVAPFLQDAELLYDTYATVIQPIPKRPSHYWHTNCNATFQTDLLGLTRLLDVIGADRVMWAADYPHTEGTFGYTNDAVRQVVENVTPDQARMILGGTAIKVFNLQ